MAIEPAQPPWGPSNSTARQRIGWQVRHFPIVDSTNSVAASLANVRDHHGLVITADAQSAGRGQYQRSWQAPACSSVLMSILVFPPPQLRQPAIFTAWAAVSVCKTIAAVTGIAATIKWPNDVLIDGKKVCGILCEGGNDHVIAGIGINVFQSRDDFEKLGLPDATSLRHCSSRPVDFNCLTNSLIEQLDAQYDRLESGQTNAIETEWKERIGLLGENVHVEIMSGSELAGRLRELAFDGLMIEQQGHLTHVPPEMVRHLRPLTESADFEPKSL